MYTVARLRAEPADRGPAPAVTRDPDVVRTYAEDASAFPAAAPAGVVRPATEAECSAYLRASLADGVAILPQAARSSLTGGATPSGGEVVVSVERLDGDPVLSSDGLTARVPAGVPLDRLQRVCVAAGRYYPPVPTYAKAWIAGTASTDAGGAATFKYGTTRRWIDGLRVVLWNGDRLAIRRGDAVVAAGGTFEIELPDGALLRVPTPRHRLPRLPKISAGYHADDPLDLVDLFVGSEGTLGVFTEVTVRLIAAPSHVLSGFVALPREGGGVALADDLRAVARAARAGDDTLPDVRSIEWADARAVALVTRAGDAARLRVPVEAASREWVWFEVELPASCDGSGTIGAIERHVEGREEPPGSSADAVRALCRVLEKHDALEGLQVALPGDAARAAALADLREAVPLRVNDDVARARAADPRVHKVAGDFVTPAAAIPEAIRAYRDAFEAAGLEYAVWGHLSDGNLHPNVRVRDAADVAAGERVIEALGRRVVELGGAPLSEHGVGRNPVKQRLLAAFLGPEALRRFARIRRALDPVGRFSPGVLLPATFE